MSSRLRLAGSTVEPCGSKWFLSFFSGILGAGSHHLGHCIQMCNMVTELYSCCLYSRKEDSKRQSGPVPTTCPSPLKEISWKSTYQVSLAYPKRARKHSLFSWAHHPQIRLFLLTTEEKTGEVDGRLLFPASDNEVISCCPGLCLPWHSVTYVSLLPHPRGDVASHDYLPKLPSQSWMLLLHCSPPAACERPLDGSLLQSLPW